MTWGRLFEEENALKGKASVRRLPTPTSPRTRRGKGRNPVNLMVVSGMQQARRSDAEEAVEVVRNHGDGTWVTLGSGTPKRR